MWLWAEAVACYRLCTGAVGQEYSSALEQQVKSLVESYVTVKSGVESYIRVKSGVNS